MVVFNHILVVCIGNICRSPVGEGFFKQMFPTKKIESAGIGVSRSGLDESSADSTMIEIAQAHELDITEHKARQLTEALCKTADLILVMEKKHIALVESISPTSRGKIMLFTQWSGNKDVPDPYGRSKEMFEYSFRLIQEAAVQWKTKLG